MSDIPFDGLVLATQTTPHATFAERLAAAQAGGYRGIGLRPADRERAHAEEGLTDSDMRSMLADHGLELVEIEVHRGFALHGEAAAESRASEDALFGLTDALGGRHMIAISDMDGDVDDAVARFAGLCDRAADHGLMVALEFLPWTDIADAGIAWQIAAAAGRSNGGVLVDSWHHFRGAADDDLIRAIPGDRIVAIQFDDADAEVVGTLLDDTLHRRRIPGEGSFDLVNFLRVLAETGTTAPIGVEVISDILASWAPLDAATQAADATRQILAEAFLS
jgi:sugar phosphate isomerase/epimerase